jgi:hypothetical protein
MRVPALEVLSALCTLHSISTTWGFSARVSNNGQETVDGGEKEDQGVYRCEKKDHGVVP